MPSFLITFRPHPNEPSILDTFLTLLFASDLFTTSSEYKYNIEKDGTPDRHFHIFLTTEKLRDKEKVYNYFSVKEFKQFKQWLLKKDTEFQHGLNVVLVGANKKRNDRLYRLGYVSKDTPVMFQNRKSTNLPVALIQEGLYYMSEWDRINIVQEKTDDIKNLTMKNVIPEILYFHREKEWKLDYLIFDRMAQVGVFTPSITESQRTVILHQLQLYIGVKQIDPYEKVFDSTIQNLPQPIHDGSFTWQWKKGHKPELCSNCNKIHSPIIECD